MTNCTDLSKAESGQNVYYRSSPGAKMLIHKVGTILSDNEIVLDFYFHYEPYIILFSSDGEHIDGGFYKPGVSRIYPMTKVNNLIYQAEQEFEIDGTL